MRTIFLTLILATFQYYTVFGQDASKQKSFKVMCVGFYNLENLFDTIVDPDPNKILQEDFTPDGPKHFTAERYQEKLENLASVIADMGSDKTPDGPAVLGVAEIENRQVLEDLVAMPSIADRNYQIVQFDSPDRRGIDVAFLYQAKYFDFDTAQVFSVVDPADTNFKTRDQLLVSGTVDGEEFHFMVAHWPSRRGGQKRSEPKRMMAAEVGRKVVDSITAANPNAKVVYMGDLNDDPMSKSLKVTMGTKGKMNKIKEGDLYNASETLFKEGIGTLAWRDNWNLFDQMICTDALITNNKDYSSYKLYRSVVFNKEYLKNQSGSFAGYPKRSYVGTTWQGGYSDHFPVYLLLIKEID